MRSARATLLVGTVLAAVATSAALADDLVVKSKAGSYDDVKFELNNAIVERGLTIDSNGQVARMLERTGADVGSTKALYKNAEYFAFCSAKLSRKMMEADPTNMGLCPYVVFIYERADKPGQISVGYRAIPKRGNATSQAALAEVESLLGGIVSDAVK